MDERRLDLEKLINQAVGLHNLTRKFMWDVVRQQKGPGLARCALTGRCEEDGWGMNRRWTKGFSPFFDESAVQELKGQEMRKTC